ncbi:TerD family protein [Angustibacter aerolatus]
MSTSLIRGANTALPPGTGRVLVSVGWRPGDVAGQPLEVDAVVIAVDVRGHVAAPDRLALFGELGQLDGTTPGTTAADEQVVIDLSAVPDDVDRVQIGAAVFRAAERGQSFAAVPGVHLRVADASSGAELGRYELQETSPVTAVVLGELYRHGDEWKLRAVGQGYRDGMAALARDVGVPV